MATTCSETESARLENQSLGKAAVPEDFSDYLEEKRILVDNHLRAALRLGDGCPPKLVEAMCYGVLAPGKRLRPILVVMAAETCGGQDVDAMPAACAVEMVHAYSLIHDDLPSMDDDDLRRGQPTCHKQFGEALAILAGDALLTLAFQTLTEGYPPTTAAACCRLLAIGAGAAGMVGGQVLDLAGEERGPQSAGDVLDSLQTIHERKTGALFRACLQLGAWVAQGTLPSGPDSSILKSLDGFGRCFGLLFQITDDLLDVEGSANETGKRVQKDAAHGKLTYPGLLGLAETRRRAADLADRARQHLTPLGPHGERLAALVPFILERKR
jgi:geranylgeranyl diphosphate synthase type II